MKAFLIDPEEQTIIEVEHDDTLQNIYKHIDADCFDMLRINNKNDVILVDDEGLYRKDHYFRYKGAENPLAGKGLVLGTNHQGESTAPTITLEQLQDNVTFISKEIALSMAERYDKHGREWEKQSSSHIFTSIADIINS